MGKVAPKMGQPKAAMEPAMYVGVPKACTFCNSTDVRFKFLNNGKMEQPRYKCLGCNKLFTHNPASRRKKHPQGYSLVARSNAGATILPANAMVTCLNPRCGKVGASKFLFFNNGKLTQPRYKCGSCNTAFTCGGRLKPKRNLEAATPHVGEGNGQFQPSNTNGSDDGEGFLPSNTNDNDDGEGNGQFQPSNTNDNDDGEGNGQFQPSNTNGSDDGEGFLPSNTNGNDDGEGNGQFQPSNTNGSDDGEGFLPSNTNDNDDGEGNGQFQPSNTNDNDDGEGNGQFQPSNTNGSDDGEGFLPSNTNGNDDGEGNGQFQPSNTNGNDDGEGNGQFQPSNTNGSDHGEGNGQFQPSNTNDNDENAVFEAVEYGEWWQALVLDAAADPEQTIGDRPLSPHANCDGHADVAQPLAIEALDNGDLESQDMPDIMAFWNSIL